VGPTFALAVQGLRIVASLFHTTLGDASAPSSIVVTAPAGDIRLYLDPMGSANRGQSVRGCGTVQDRIAKLEVKNRFCVLSLCTRLGRRGETGRCGAACRGADAGGSSSEVSWCLRSAASARRQSTRIGPPELAAAYQQDRLRHEAGGGHPGPAE
jgi:hypothetical protein